MGLTIILEDEKGYVKLSVSKSPTYFSKLLNKI